MKKIFIWNAGAAEHSQTCYQSTIVYEFFRKNEYDILNEPKEADVILLNGYPFDNYEEKIALLSINYYLQKYSKKKIIVFGSIPNMIFWIKKIKDITFISYSEYHIFDTLFPHKISVSDINIWRIKFFLPLIIESISLWDLYHNNLWENINLETEYELTEYELSITVDDIINKTYPIDKIWEYDGKYNYLEDNKDNYYIETTRWCWFRCSYCVIQKVSWFTKSFPINKIISDVKKWLSLWAKNIIIIDEDCWSYGIDIGLTFSYLINEINKINWDFRLKFYYLEPLSLEKNFSKIDESFWLKVSYIRITIQTTSPRILKLMNRKYDIWKILDISKKLKLINKNIILWSIVIYGFPTETFQEFKDYFKLLKYYDCTDFLCYADKKGTKVSNLQKNSYNDILKKSLIILKVKEKVWDKIDPVINSFTERMKILKTCY